MNITLEALLHDLIEIPHGGETLLRSLSLNTRELQQGALFLALPGKNQDGRNYIDQAIAQGAAAVLLEATGSADFTYKGHPGVPVFSVPKLGSKLEAIARRFYKDPTSSLRITGVTGTNGKTTTCYLLAQALQRLSIPTGIIGTLGYGRIGDLHPCNLTTPGPIALQQYFSDLKEAGVSNVAMEVSSHGLEQGRVEGVPFVSALFSNLTQDHLDYHGNMQAYAQAKQKFFAFDSIERAVFYACPEYSPMMVEATPADLPIAVVTLDPNTIPRYVGRSQVAVLSASHYTITTNGIVAQVQSPWGTGWLQSSLLGSFNVQNLLLVLGELCLSGVPFQSALDALRYVKPPPGRMQKIGGVHSPQIIIDYAHTPDALEKGLQAARAHCTRRLWCIFGCGGDRDQEKRPIMGRIATQYADHVVITSDNPRTERPESIIQEIVEGIYLEESRKVVIEADRALAIEYALNHALIVDTIFIAGKGHENYQIIGEQYLPFSDEVCVNQLLDHKDTRYAAVTNR